MDKFYKFSGADAGWMCGFRPAACLHVTGEDALTFLQGQFTQELRSAAEAPVAYGLWLNQKGKVLADSFVLREAADSLWIISFSSVAAVIRERLEAYVIADDVVIEDVTADWAGVAVGGPEAEAWLVREAGGVPAVGEFIKATGGGWVFRGRRGVESFEWVRPVSAAAWEGRSEVAEEELERVRIGAGIPRVPQDIGVGDLPNEGGLDVVGISYTKGCYLGQEVMARLKAMGTVRRRLVRVRGAGLSSSAAIELASGLAFLSLTGQDVDRETLVKIGKHAENNFVGVPCGILDQGVSGFGKAGRLVFIDCRGPRFDTVPMPEGAHFWIFNTHTKHALVDGLYATRHRECMEAAKALGVSFLVEAKPATVEASQGKLSADAFKRAKHVVDEIARVDLTVMSLENGDLTTVGGLLTASHRSSQLYFGNSTEELDFLVDTLTTTEHVYGARLTGGGFGGAVMALTDASFGESQAQAVAAAYEKKYGAKPDVLHMLTGDGAQVL